MSNSTKMTQSELTNVFSLVRELTNKETFHQSFYYPQIFFFNPEEDCTMDNCIYVGQNPNGCKVYIHIAPIVNGLKEILEISTIDLQMVQLFYLPTVDIAKAVYTQYANQIYEFYTDHAK